MNEFAERLKHLRVDVLKLSMKNIAIDLNTNQSSFSQYENGMVKPGLSFILSLCLKYYVSANWLIMGIGPIMIKDLSTTAIDTTSTMVRKHKQYEDKLNNIQNQLKNAIEEYKRKL
jgi:transcriptional regulator with XRE-family HTH domain